MFDIVIRETGSFHSYDLHVCPCMVFGCCVMQTWCLVAVLCRHVVQVAHCAVELYGCEYNDNEHVLVHCM